MMNFDSWRDGLISVIEIFANEESQKKIWIEGNKEVFSSWEEAYCQLFDDLDLNGFISTYCCVENTKISVKACASLSDFRNALTSYGDNLGSFADPKTVISDSKWHQVCILAKKALDDLCEAR
jgi:hypothetical protein